MPWCPQCGAEYREGITRCAKCGVPLTEEAPAAQIVRWRERVPPWLQRIIGDFCNAFRYIAEAWRVLRRHPALLLLPLAAAVFNAVEGGTMTYVGFRYTAVGRELAAEYPLDRDVRAAMVRLRPGDVLGAAVNRFTYPVPAPSLGGTWRMMELAAIQRHSNWAVPSAAWVLSLLLILPLGALVLAGYYGVVARAVTEEAVSWRPFWGDARRYFVRFYLFGVLLAVLTGGLAMIVLSLRATMAIYPAVTFVGKAITLALALTLVAVVADDRPLRRALPSGAAVVLGCLPVSVFLFALWLVVLASRVLLGHLLGLAPLPPVDFATLQLYQIPQSAVLDGLVAIVGTWLLIASFVWYRDRRPAVRPCPEPPAA